MCHIASKKNNIPEQLYSKNYLDNTKKKWLDT